jgi:FkbM family methyltransferase
MVDGDAPGYILFTSGTSGQPKGVVQTRRTLDSVVNWQVHRSGKGSRPRTLQRSALSFDVALQEILSTVADGGTLYLPADQQRQDLSHMATLINKWQVERIFMPPSGLHALLAAADTSRLSSLREVVCAGEPLVVTGTVRRAFRVINAKLDNQYGPTETHVCTAVTVEGDPFTWPDNPSIGLPVPGDAARVVDALGRRLPMGTPGELVITGQTVALGYLHGADPKFTESLGLDGTSTVRSYRTGDFAKERPDGSFEFLRRRDEQVKVRGYRVELGEVETAALATGLAADAVAFGLGGGSAVERIGLAVLSPTQAAGLDRGALLREMSERLPPYMMPRPAETVLLERFESTPTGKVDRRRVAEVAQTYLSEQHTDSGSAEQMIRSLWGRCLGIDEFGEDATFVALGGDSLAAVELAAALQDTVGAAVSLRELLAGMTVRNLLSRARGGHESADAAQQDGRAQPDRSDPQSVMLPRFGRVECVSPAEAKHLYLDIVVSRNYERFGILDRPLGNVVDVGANIGLFALSVLDRHPKTNVITLEPHPGFARALRANVGKRVSVVEAAAAAEQGYAPLYVYEQMPAMSSLRPEPDYDNALMASLIGNQLTRVGADTGSGAMVGLAVEAPTVQEVQTVRLSDVLAQHQCESVGLLKVDVQHGEVGVFEGLDDADWSRLERIVVEVQDRGTELAALQRLLEARGFSTAVHVDTVLHAGSAIRFLYAWAPAQRGPAV